MHLKISTNFRPSVTWTEISICEVMTTPPPPPPPIHTHTTLVKQYDACLCKVTPECPPPPPPPHYTHSISDACQCEVPPRVSDAYQCERGFPPRNISDAWCISKWSPTVSMMHVNVNQGQWCMPIWCQCEVPLGSVMHVIVKSPRWSVTWVAVWQFRQC